MCAKHWDNQCAHMVSFIPMTTPWCRCVPWCVPGFQMRELRHWGLMDLLQGHSAHLASHGNTRWAVGLVAVTEVHRQWPKPARSEFFLCVSLNGSCDGPGLFDLISALSRGVAPCVWSLKTHHHSSSQMTGKEQWGEAPCLHLLCSHITGLYQLSRSY